MDYLSMKKNYGKANARLEGADPLYGCYRWFEVWIFCLQRAKQYLIIYWSMVAMFITQLLWININ